MRRPLFLLAIALILGISTACIIQSLFITIAEISLLLFLAAVLSFKYRSISVMLIGMVLAYAVGAMEYMYFDHNSTGKFKDYSGSEVVIKGFVDSEPDIRETKVLYVLKTESIDDYKAEKRIKGRILLTTLKDGTDKLYGYGERLEVRGALNTAKGSRNPGGFNYKGYLVKSGISAAVFAKNYNIHEKGSGNTNFLVKTGAILRERIVTVIDKSLPKEQAGLLNGMLIGYRDGLSKDVQTAFSDSGLSHVMAVSGMNVAFIIIPLVFVFKKLRIGQKAANVIIIAVLLLFVYITGFSPSVVRAVIMGVIVLLGQVIMRETDIYTSLSLAAILLLLYNPYNLFDIGFQLSFCATLSLVFFYKNIKDKLNFRFMPEIISSTLAATIAAQIGVLPIIVFYFNKVSIVSLISNLLVVPLVGLVTILGFMMAIIGQVSIVLSQYIGYVNCSLLTFILYVVKISSQLPFAVIKAVTPSPAAILSYYALILFFFWYKPVFRPSIKPSYYIAASGIAVAALLVTMLLPRDLSVTFIDVGQGDSIFISSYAGRTVLIDGGGQDKKISPGPDIGEMVVMPFLLDSGTSKLDMVIATHGHDDHIQGLMSVLENFDVGTLVIPDVSDKAAFTEVLKIARNKGIMVSTCRKGDIIRLDGKTYLKVLHPAGNYNESRSTLNNGSLVMKLYYKNISMLFTGDIEKEAEAGLISSGENLEADILKVAHHGSQYSTSSDFLDAVDPAAAVVSVGRNSFGHPSDDTLQRITEDKIQLFRTDKDGAVIVKSNGEKLKITHMVESR